MSSGVELSVTVWERTYRSTLRPDWFDRLASMLGRTFEHTSVVINNVESPDAARRLADGLVTSGRIDSFLFTQEHLSQALHGTGLARRAFAPIPHYTDHFLVKAHCAVQPLLLHWDTDAVQRSQLDWVAAGASLLGRASAIGVVNPDSPHQRLEDNNSLWQDKDFLYGHGFSDQVFLARAADLRSPIYRHVAPATWWQPTSWSAAIFEQRIDAWLRATGRFRAVCRGVEQVHDADMADQSPTSTVDRLRRRARHESLMALNRPSAPYRPRWVMSPSNRSLPPTVSNAVERARRQTQSNADS